MRPNFIAVLFIRSALVLVFLFGIFICCWYPFVVAVSSGMPFMDYIETEITLEMNIEIYTKLLFYWILSLPCFAVVVMGFIDTVFARKYGTFNIKSEKILFKMALILFISSVIYIIGNIFFMLLGWNLSPLYFTSEPSIPLGLFYCIIGVFGLLFSVGIYAIYKYTVRGIAKNNA